nr:unnamed protein product [Spirometra erinaceieuropaei]
MSEKIGDVDSSLEDKVEAASSDSDVLSLGEERTILERTAQSTSNRSGRRQSSLDEYLRESKPGIENYLLKSKESLHEKLEKTEDDYASVRERKRLERNPGASKSSYEEVHTRANDEDSKEKAAELHFGWNACR